jgi:ribosomal protein L24E
VNQKHETDLRLAIALTRAPAEIYCRSAWVEFSDKAKRASSGDVIDLIAKLNRYSRTLHRYAEMDCNAELTPGDGIAYTRTEAKARALCHAWGIGCEIQTDPRAGCGLVVRVDGQRFYLANSKGN